MKNIDYIQPFKNIYSVFLDLITESRVTTNYLNYAIYQI